MKILFVGNSYTFYFDLPQRMEALLKENGVDATVDSVTVGGRKLKEHFSGTDENALRLRELAKSETYDVLFLQEQSYYALVDRTAFLQAVGDLKALFSPKRTLLYVTWGRKDGCKLLEQYGPKSRDMTRALSDAYAEASKRCHAELSPAGACFEACQNRFPSLELYDEDLSHPSLLGSTLALLCHYRSLMGSLPKKNDSLALEDALLDPLKQAVELVFQNKKGEGTMNTYEFEDRATHLETYEWDDIWWEQTQKTDAKRILYIGDSISRGTRRLVTKLSEETILCDGYATSKGLDNPYLLPTLHLFASQEKKRDAVLFNNGLHGWNLDEETDYPLYYEKVVQGLLKEFPDTPIVLVLTTHIKSPSRDPRVQKRNEAAKAIAEKYSLPVLDFYRLTVENVHLRGEDGVHYAPEGYELMAKAVIDCVNAL